MRRFGDHGLVDAAVEAAKIEPHSWQAAKLRSVGSARGGLRSAAAALCFHHLSLRGGTIHGWRVSARTNCRLQIASRLSQSLRCVFLFSF